MIRPRCQECGYVTLARFLKLCAYCGTPVQRADAAAEEE